MTEGVPASKYERLMAEIDALPKQRPMSPLVRVMTTAGGFAAGCAIAGVTHGDLLLTLCSTAGAAVLLTPLAVRVQQRAHIRREEARIRKEAHGG